MGEESRRQFLVASSALLATPFVVDAQPVPTVPRIGFLSLDLNGNPRGADAFRTGLRDVGYVEGRTIVVEYRDARGQLDRIPELAAELVALRVDVIVAPNVLAVRAASRATRTIPIVFAGLTDPVADGFVASLAHPGGNVTGLSNLSPELVAKRLEFLKQAAPRITRVAILWQPGGGGESVSHREMLAKADAAATSLGIRLGVVEARGPGDLDAAIVRIAKDRADALTVLGTPMFFVERARIVALAARHRLPAIYSSRQFADAGGLMTYGASLDDLLRRATTYVDRILKGALPADLPVEQPTKFELVVNLKAAMALRLAIPPMVLNRADVVIE